MGSSIHANYWANNTLKAVPKKLDIPDLIKLSGLRSSIADFVYILTNKNIPVDFSSGRTSFTDGSSVIISAVLDEFKWDAIIGLALHEGAHIKYTDFKWLRAWTRNPTKYIPSDIFDLGKAKGYEEEDVKKLIKSLDNYVEDLYIDHMVYKTAPGYRPYYKAMYDSDWHSPKVDEYLRTNPIWRLPFISSYMSQIVSCTNKNFDKTALPQLDDIVKLIDLKHIERFASEPKWRRSNEKLPEKFYIVLDMVRIIYTHCLEKSTEDNMSEQLEKARKGEKNDISKMFPNYDMQMMLGKLTKEQLLELLKNAKEITDKQDAFLNGNVIKIQLDAEDLRNLDSINAKNATLKKTGPMVKPSKSTGKVPKELVSVLLNVDKNLVDSQIFPFKNNYGHINDLTGGKIGGSILSNKLQIRNEQSKLTYTRKNSGRIFQRHLYMVGAGVENIFYTDEYKEFDPIRMHVSLDASGSMAEDAKWRASINLLTSLIIASKKINGIHLTADLRGSAANGAEGSCIAVIFDSKIDNLSKLDSVISKLYPNGSTPEGLCFEAIKDYIIKTSSDKSIKYFVNISDGMPYKPVRDSEAGEGYSYSGDVAFKHTAEQMKDFRETDINIISYFINSEGYYTDTMEATDGFKKMYGKDAQMLNVENMNLIAISLNKLFLETLSES